MENPPETPFPTRAEEKPSHISGLSPILTKLSLKWRLEETEDGISTKKQIKNTRVEGEEGGPSPRNIKTLKKKKPKEKFGAPYEWKKKTWK